MGGKGFALINSIIIHRWDNKWLFKRLTRKRLALLIAAQHASTHLVKRERRRAGAGGSETPDSSTVQRPLRLVCKRLAGRETNSSGSGSRGEGAVRLERRQRSVVLEQTSPVIFLSGNKKEKGEREIEREKEGKSESLQYVRLRKFKPASCKRRPTVVQTRSLAVSKSKTKGRLEKF